jgi:predicted amidohydrolase
MKVSTLQTDIKWADPIANQQAVESALLASAPADLYVLPEMWDTGFMAQPSALSPQPSDISLQFMQRMAKRLNAAIAGSIAVQEPSALSPQPSALFNRLYFVTPEETFFYDKRHLFSYAGEDKTFTAGEQPVVVEWRGVKFMLQVCYDLRFPCFSRNKLLPPSALSPLYDAVIYVANWPESRRRVWDILLQARALENQCFVIGVNRVGDDPNCHYNGGTVIIDAKGKTLASVADDTEGIATAELDMQFLQSFREKFPVLRDADN